MVVGIQLVACGMVGAALAEMITMRGLSQNNRKAWNREKHRVEFWLFTAGFIAAGGFMAWAQGGNGAQLTRFLAVNVGFTWPLLLRRSINALPTKPYKAN